MNYTLFINNCEEALNDPENPAEKLFAVLTAEAFSKDTEQAALIDDISKLNILFLGRDKPMKRLIARIVLSDIIQIKILDTKTASCGRKQTQSYFHELAKRNNLDILNGALRAAEEATDNEQLLKEAFKTNNAVEHLNEKGFFSTDLQKTPQLLEQHLPFNYIQQVLDTVAVAKCFEALAKLPKCDSGEYQLRSRFVLSAIKYYRLDMYAFGSI